MARPKKATLDYFPHFVNSGKTIFILESNYGNDGYAFWFKLLEILAGTVNHVYDCNNLPDWQFLIAKTRVSEETANSILKTLATLEAIDKELWESKILWVQNLVDNVSDVYKRREAKTPQKPSLCIQKPHEEDVSDNENPQSKVKERKVKESKVKQIISENVDSVFDYYCAIFSGYYDRLTLTEKRRSHIAARLKTYEVEDIEKAIDNLRLSKWHLGEDEKNTKFFATIDFIMRSDEQIETWINYKNKKSSNNNTNKAIELYEKALEEERRGEC